MVSPSRAMSMKSALRDLPYCIIGHDWHSADWLAALASPYPAAPDFPRKRGQNKTPRNTLFINGSTVSTGYSATVEVLHRTSTVLYTSRGREPGARPGGVSRSQAEPLAPRAVRPGGAINPRGKAASTFGNTGKRRILTKAHDLKCRTQQKSTNHHS